MILFILHMVAALSLVADDRSAVILQEAKVYTVSEVSVKPQPASGLQDFQDTWSKKVVFPEDAIKENIQGVVFIEFVVNEDGTIGDAAVRRGIGHGCDEAALKGFKEVSEEKWKPGMLHEQPVNVKMVLPFYFRILKN